MFFGGQRIISVRKMILANNKIDRERALSELLPMQRGDFEEIFTELNGLPATVRLLDPPLHEFLPNDHTSRHEMALQLGISVEEIAQKTAQLHEFNPMLGFRGCRLAVVYPEILHMQVRAIIEAACACVKKKVKVRPEIMIPLSIDARELGILVQHTRAVAGAVLDERKVKLDYLVGTMIETPRAALTAEKLAEVSEFFSFGTNDLTQMTMGLSRDDAGRFLPTYVDRDKAAIFAADPFQSIDVDGVGALVDRACRHGRKVSRTLKLGVCGEHGGDPQSIAFFARAGLDYVSCSPFRVPIARLVAAQLA